MLDNHEDSETVAAGVRLDECAKWQDVPPGLLALYPSAGSFLDLEGKLFYLPALMKWNLMFGPTCDVYPADILERPEVASALTEHLDPARQAVYDRYLDYVRSLRPDLPRDIV